MSLENSHSTEENFVEKTSIKIKDRNIMNLEKSEFFKHTGRPRTVNVGINYWPERVTGHKTNLKLHS